MSQLGKPFVLNPNTTMKLGVKNLTGQLPLTKQLKLANVQQQRRHRAYVTAASLNGVSLPHMLGKVRSAADRFSPFRILQQKSQQEQGRKRQVDQQQQLEPVQEDGSPASWTIAAHIPLSGSTAPSPGTADTSSGSTCGALVVTQQTQGNGTTEAAAAAVPGCGLGKILGIAGSPCSAAGSHAAAAAAIVPGTFSVSGSYSQVPAVAPHGAPCSSCSTSSSTSSSANSSSSVISSATSSSGSSSSLRFAKHLANVTNGCAPPSTRFESLGWLLFETKRLQTLLQQQGLAPNQQQVLTASTNSLQPDLAWTESPEAWLRSPEKKQLLEQVYLIGQAVADLGTADGLQPLSSSNGSRAIASMDYAKLLERYLQQHGLLLAESFWAQLPDDELQAKAIHVAMSLETRCTVHTLLFDKLIDRVGFDGPGIYGFGSSSFPSASHSGPLATAITNTTINTSQLLNSPYSSQSVVAAPSANGNSSSAGNSSSSAAVTGGQQGESLGSKFGAVFVLVWTLAGKAVQVFVAVVVFAKDLAMHLLMLRAMAAAAKAVTAASSPQLQAVPGAAAAAAAGVGGRSWSKQETQVTAVQPKPAAAAAPTPAAATPAPKAATAAASAGSGDGNSSSNASGGTGSSGGDRRERWAGGSTAVGSLGLLSASPLVNKPGGVGTGSVAAVAGSPPTGTVVGTVPSSSSVGWQQEQQQQQQERKQQVVADATAEALPPAAALFWQVVAKRQQLQARVQQQLDVEQQQQQQQPEVQKECLQQQQRCTSIGDQQQHQQQQQRREASHKRRAAAAKWPGFKAGCGSLLFQLWAPEAAREGVNVV